MDARQKRRSKEKQRDRLSKRSLVTDANRPKMKSSVQIVCAIGEWNFNASFFLLFLASPTAVP